MNQLGGREQVNGILLKEESVKCRSKVNHDGFETVLVLRKLHKGLGTTGSPSINTLWIRRVPSRLVELGRIRTWSHGLRTRTCCYSNPNETWVFV